jgi:hypothetical protein
MRSVPEVLMLSDGKLSFALIFAVIALAVELFPITALTCAAVENGVVPSAAPPLLVFLDVPHDARRSMMVRSPATYDIFILVLCIMLFIPLCISFS